MCIFLFKQKTAYEMRISDWSSDVCSSDLPGDVDFGRGLGEGEVAGAETHFEIALEERAHELGQGALEVGEAGVLVDQQAFDLVEHRRMGLAAVGAEIGRASCRARVCQYV